MNKKDLRKSMEKRSQWKVKGL